MNDSHLSILLVIEDPGRRREVCQALTAAGYACAEAVASSWAEACDLFEARPFDVCLAEDALAPTPAALRTARETPQPRPSDVVRRSMHHINTPVLVLLPAPDAARAADLLRAGATGCLTDDDVGTGHLGEAVGRARARWAGKAEHLRLGETYRAIVENAQDIITVLERDATIRYESPSIERLLGYGPREIIGRNAFEFIHPDDMPDVIGVFDHGVRHPGYTATLEYRFRHRDGSWRTLESRAKNMLDDPEVRGLVVNSRDITERIEAEQALRRSEQRNRALLDAIPDAMVRLTREGRYLDVHLPREYKAFVDIEQLRGASAFDILPPHVAPRAMACVARAIETGQVQSFEYEIDVLGDVRVREARVMRCGDDEVISIQRDITERKRAENEVKRLKAFYEQVLDDLPADVAVMDPEGRILYLNKASVKDPEMREWLLGKTGLDYCRRRGLDETIAQRRLDYIHRTAASQQVLRFEETLVKPSGERRHVLRMTSPVLGPDGTVHQVIGYGLDITERKNTEEALRKSEALLRTIVSNIPVILFALNREGRFTLAEGKGLEALNAQPGEAVGRSVFDLYEDRPHFLRNVRRALNGDTFSTLVEVSGRAFECWFSPLAGPEGQAPGVIGVAADITEIKSKERALKQSRQQLRELALHLQSVREEERTRISREVHDVLGQALTALRMDIAWIERSTQEDADLIRRLDGMKELIDTTIRTTRRIAADLRPGVLDDLGLAAALEWQAEQFEARTGVVCSFCDTTGLLELDRDRSTALFRIFQEILTNVARHAEAPHVDIHLEILNGDLVLTVQDDGRGIRQQDIENTKSLGLLGMRERVVPWGGDVRLQGAPGIGTNVTVTVPLATVPAEADSASAGR